MAKVKTKTIYFCKECGYESSKWMGQCPGCRSWNSLVEEKVTAKKPEDRGTGSGQGSRRGRLTRLSEVSMTAEDRIASGIPELDRVLGGGIVKGSLSLVGGDPGIGKSTLLLQVCRNLSNQGLSVVYVSGEESLRQIRMRADRLGGFEQDPELLCETDLDTAVEALRQRKPDRNFHRRQYTWYQTSAILHR